MAKKVFKKEPLFTAKGAKFIKGELKILVKNIGGPISHCRKLYYYLNHQNEQPSLPCPPPLPPWFLPPSHATGLYCFHSDI